MMLIEIDVAALRRARDRALAAGDSDCVVALESLIAIVCAVPHHTIDTADTSDVESESKRVPRS
jgi:hypothetical protein